MIFDVNGNPLSAEGSIQNNILAAVVLDASEKFAAMKQLLDIGKRKLADPNATVSASDFTQASKGAVCALPASSTAMYEKYPFSMLYTKNETVQAVPASTTKVMSLITGLDYVDNVNEVITISSSDPQAGSGGYFSAGDTMTIRELMLAMMLPSSNTAAQAFARVCGNKMLQSAANGTYSDSECVTEFISKMNTKAAYIGMTNSVFTSPSGLASTTYVTAEDMVKMVVEACSYPEILKVWNKKSYTFAVGGTNPRNVNLATTVTDTTLENSYYIFGGKTGTLGGASALVMVAGIK